MFLSRVEAEKKRKKGMTKGRQANERVFPVDENPHPTFDFQLGLLKMRNPREAKGKIRSRGDNTKEEKKPSRAFNAGCNGEDIYMGEFIINWDLLLFAV